MHEGLPALPEDVYEAKDGHTYEIRILPDTDPLLCKVYRDGELHNTFYTVDFARRVYRSM
jgi:hypothetical protein